VYRRKDAFHARAKAAGYRSRSAYKLLELARRGRLLRRGDRVVDLGAWPGGWLQVAAQLVGPSGQVVGVDLRAIDPLPDGQVLIVGDVQAAEVQDRILEACGGRVDVVLSDLSPKLSGIRARDEAQAEALAECALNVCSRLLRPGGRLLMKLFMSPALPAFLDRLRDQFGSVSTTRPEATRKGSSEIYALATDFLGRSRPILPPQN
jgi:23S rRNA (uridine2552-2'-O)-methyltransferase